jgi:hypothetical protein
MSTCELNIKNNVQKRPILAFVQILFVFLSFYQTANFSGQLKKNDNA